MELRPRIRFRLAGVLFIVIVMMTMLTSQSLDHSDTVLAQTEIKAASGLISGTQVITEWVEQDTAIVDETTGETVVKDADYPKLESQLEQLYESAVLNEGRALETFSGQQFVFIDSRTVRVILEMEIDPEAHPGGAPWIETIDLGGGQTTQVEHAAPVAIRAELLSAIETAGGTYETAYLNLVQVLSPFESLVKLSEIEGVGRVRLPYPSTPLEVPAQGGPASEVDSEGSPEVVVYTSEGVSLTNAGDWHAEGFDGSGVQLAVYDFGFTNWDARIIGGDLPAGTITHDYSAGGYDFTTDPTTYEHGSACAEIAYDMAPGSTVHLYAFETEVELGNAVANFATYAGNKVASMSIGWVNAGPYDGTGVVDDIVELAADTHGIYWAISAGNDRTQHYSWTSSQYGTGDSVAFGTGNIEGYGPEPGSVWNINAGTEITAFLEWNDWNASRTGNQNHQDYDIYLLRWNGSSWVQVASSVADQCTGSEPPIEIISYIPSNPGYFGLMIQRYTTGCSNNFGHWMQLYTFTGFYEAGTGSANSFWYSNPCNSLGIPSEADRAISVGATFWNEDSFAPSYGLETFSSCGARNAYGGGNPGSAVDKVDVVAPDGVSTVSYGVSDGVNYASGGSGFWGTSGAAPHVAGLAATIWEAYPSYSLAQIRSYIEAQASDRVAGACGGGASNNNTYGEGRINLPEAPIVNTWTGAMNTNWDLGSNWSSGSAPDGSCSQSVLIPTGLTNYPTLSSETWVRKITIESGASVSGASQTLHVCGDWVNSGTFNGDSGTVSFDGVTAMSGGSSSNHFNHLVISAGHSMDSGSETLYVSGNWTDNGAFNAGTSSVKFLGTSDIAQRTPVTTYLLNESFTGTTFPPTGWDRSRNRWIRETTIFQTSPAASNTGINNNTAWLRTPPIQLGNHPWISFWERTNTAGTFALWACTSNCSSYGLGGWVSITSFNNVSPIWRQNTISLASYANQNVYLAFQHISANNETNRRYIDDVMVYNLDQDQTFYDLSILSGHTTFLNNLNVTNDLTVNTYAMLDVGANKILSVGGTYTYLGGWVSNQETRIVVSSTAANFNDARGNLTAQLTRGSGSANYTVTTRAGWIFPPNDFGTTCPQVTNAVFRYYDITTPSPASTTVRLYYQDAEINENIENDLGIYHCVGGAWQLVPGTTHSTAENWVQMTVSSFSPFILAGQEPDAIELVRFESWSEYPDVELIWETATEIDNLGFNLYRSTSIDGERIQINAELIPAQEPGSPLGHVYTFTDVDLEAAGTYYYWLEDVDLYGSASLHGPIWVIHRPDDSFPYIIYIPFFDW